jgi:hypothetical protein
MRKFARIGMTLGAMAALAMATTGTASAAPATFSVAAVHSSGAGATSTRVLGDLHWSPSLKTVQVSNIVITAKAGECGYAVISGYQGSTKVAPDQITTVVCGDFDVSRDITLTATVPGGIGYVHVAVIDRDHPGTEGYGNCHQNESKCRISYK